MDGKTYDWPIELLRKAINKTKLELGERRTVMLFMITQIHTPETCPKDAGGADVLIDKNA